METEGAAPDPDSGANDRQASARPVPAGQNPVASERIRLLVNLPSGFYSLPDLETIWHSFDRFAEVERTDMRSAEEFLPRLQSADAVLMWSWPLLSAEQLATCPRLQFAGHLDIRPAHARALLEQGVAVSTGPGAWAPAVAEMALLLILESLRRTPDYHAAMRQGTERWVRVFPDEVDPRERELSGRAVGLVGFGSVGRRLARLLAPFDCRVAVHDPFLPADVAIEAGVAVVEMEELIRRSEVLVLCASANSGTRHLFGAAEIEALRPGAVVVNVSRGALIDTEAMIRRARRGDVSFALDVFETEPLPADSELRSLPGVYLTPHRAGGTIASVVRILTCLRDDLIAHFEGRERRYPLLPAMLAALDE